MLEDKVAIIKEEGIPVQIVRTPTINTMALIGRIQRSGNDFFSLESQRKGVFLPDTILVNGDIIHDVILNIDYLAISVFPEIINQITVAYHALLIKCNAKITVISFAEEAINGHIKQIPNTPVTLKAYRQMASEKLKQLDSGLVQDSKFVIYTSVNDAIQLNSQVLIDTDKFKVSGVDTTSFENLMAVQLTPDIRK